MSRLAALGLALVLLAGCATYRAPALPLSATAEERQRSATCEARAAQEAREASTSIRWEQWIPGTALDLALAPIAYPLMAWQVKKDREMTFDLAYQRCMAWGPDGQGWARQVTP